MEKYPSNSHNKVQTEGTKTVKRVETTTEVKPEKKIERVTTGTVIQRKKPLGKRFAETFGGGDAQGVASYILQDVLLPAAKDMVADAVSQGIEKMLFGEARGGGRSRLNNTRKSASTYTSYNKFAVNPGHRREVENPKPMSRRAKATHDFDEIILASRAEAQQVLEQMVTLVDEYEEATVADLYEMVGMTSDFTDNNWGWSSLRGSSVSRVRDGWLLDLPQPEVIA